MMKLIFLSVDGSEILIWLSLVWTAWNIEFDISEGGPCERLMGVWMAQNIEFGFPECGQL